MIQPQTSENSNRPSGRIQLFRSPASGFNSTEVPSLLPPEGCVIYSSPWYAGPQQGA